MTADDWAFIKTLAKEKGVTLKDAGVKRTQRLGYAIDCVLVAREAQTGFEWSSDTDTD